MRNRHNLNIIVHGQNSNFWSLGLARIGVTLPDEKCIQLLEEKLEKHELNLHTDIVAIITDGRYQLLTVLSLKDLIMRDLVKLTKLVTIHI